MTVKLINEQDLLDLDLALLKKIGNEALKHSRGSSRVTVVFVNAKKITRLNKQFLGRETTTDVLAFPESDKGSKGKDIGEVVVNVEEGLNVAEQDSSVAHDEVALYLVHGILHLVGPFDDTTEAGAAEMHAAEDEILEKFDISVD